MTGVNELAGGQDTARVPAAATDAEVRRREDRRRTARGNLAAMAIERHPGAATVDADGHLHPGDPDKLAAALAWRDEIAEALGLVEPAKKRRRR